MRVLRNLLIVTAVLMSAVYFVPAQGKEKAAEENASQVELFDAIDQGLVEVKMKQNGALEGNLSVKNISGQPLKIDMPAAFAAVPIAQFGMGGPMGGMMGGPMGGMMGGPAGGPMGGPVGGPAGGPLGPARGLGLGGQGRTSAQSQHLTPASTCLALPTQKVTE